jgi:hypothetical protein
VPGQQSSWRDQPTITQRCREQPGKCRQDRPVGPVRPGQGHLAAEHHDFVTRHLDLRVLGRLAAAQQNQPAKDADHDQVQQTPCRVLKRYRLALGPRNLRSPSYRHDPFLRRGLPTRLSRIWQGLILSRVRPRWRMRRSAAAAARHRSQDLLRVRQGRIPRAYGLPAGWHVVLRRDAAPGRRPARAGPAHAGLPIFLRAPVSSSQATRSERPYGAATSALLSVALRGDRGGTMSRLQEGQQVGVDGLGLRGGHTVREAAVGLQRPVLEQLGRQWR